MHVFEIVLEDGSEGFYEDDFARYIFLYENLLSEIATKSNLTPIKYYDGFKEAETIADSKVPDSNDIKWLSAYNEAREQMTPTWFDPSDALKNISPVIEQLQIKNKTNNDDDIDFLIESIEELKKILNSAKINNSRFYMAIM